MIRIRLLTTLLIALPLCSPSHANETAPYSLAISGGISLGNYEAGMNWAIIAALKHLREPCETGDTAKCKRLRDRLANLGIKYQMPELITVTGASAGAINTLATALEWCQWDRSESDRNLFATIWLDVGFDKLMPADLKKYDETISVPISLQKPEGLLSRRSAFKTAFTALQNTLGATNFRPNCNLNIAVTLTREEAANFNVLDDMTVVNSRFVVPLRFETVCNGAATSCRAVVRPYLDIGDDDRLGNVIYPPLLPDGTVAFENLADVLLTSSAFPVAFGKVNLDYCVANKNYLANKEKMLLPNDGKHCPSNSKGEPFYREKAYFLDGGLFDNVPLGSARILAESYFNKSLRNKYNCRKTPSRCLAHQGKYRYIYMDPDNVRNDKHRAGVWYQQMRGHFSKSKPEQEQQQCHGFGLICQLSFALGAARSSRQYELYNELRSGYWGNGPDNRRNQNCNPTFDRNCRVRELLISDRYPQLTGSFIGAFGAFLDREFRDYDYYVGIYDALVNVSSYFCQTHKYDKAYIKNCAARLRNELADALIANDTNGKWLFDMFAALEFEPEAELAEYADVDNAFQSVALAIELGYHYDGSFHTFIKFLRDGYDPLGFQSAFPAPNKNTVFTDIWYEKYPQWWVTVARRAMPRLQQLENRTNRSLGLLINTIGLGLETAFPGETKKGFALSNSTAEKWYFDLLPHQIEANVDGSGWGVSWEPTFRFKGSNRFHIGFKVTPTTYTYVNNDKIRFSEASAYLALSLGNSNLYRIGAGPSFTRTNNEIIGFDRETKGWSAYFEFARKLRLTIGRRDNDGKFAGDDHYVNIGIVDLPGLAYWFTR